MARNRAALNIRNTSRFRQRLPPPFPPPEPTCPTPPNPSRSLFFAGRCTSLSKDGVLSDELSSGHSGSIHRAYSSTRSHFSVLPPPLLPLGGNPRRHCSSPIDILANRIRGIRETCPVRDSRASHERFALVFARTDKGSSAVFFFSSRSFLLLRPFSLPSDALNSFTRERFYPARMVHPICTDYRERAGVKSPQLILTCA